MKRLLSIVPAAAALLFAVGLCGLGLYWVFGGAADREPAVPPAADAPVATAPAPAAPAASAASPPAAAPAAVAPAAAPSSAEILAPATPTDGFVRTVETPAEARDVGGGVVAGPAAVGPVVRLTPAPKLAATPDDARPQRFFRVLVVDAGTLRAGERTLRLADVDIPNADAVCGDGRGHRWSCGTRARTALRRLVRHRAVDCRPAGAAAADGGTTVVRCAVGGVDLATWLVEHGWAAAAADAPAAMTALGRAARDAGLGLWQVEPVGLDESEEGDAADANPAPAAPAAPDTPAVAPTAAPAAPEAPRVRPATPAP